MGNTDRGHAVAMPAIVIEHVRQQEKQEQEFDNAH